MKRTFAHTWIRLLLALAVVAGGGCARHYVMKLSNGMTVTTASRPQLKGGLYYYKDASGREVSIPQSRVREIVPASMAKEEKPMFRSAPVR